MQTIKDTSTARYTQLETVVIVGRRRKRVRVAVPGRDVWAYQMAKIELQNCVLKAMKESTHPPTTRSDGNDA